MQGKSNGAARYNAVADLLDGNLVVGREDKVAIRTSNGAELTPRRGGGGGQPGQQLPRGA